MRTPILQIVHYTDMHIVGPDYRRQRRAVDRIKPLLSSGWQQGLAGASRDALLAFEDFLKTDVAGDADWGSCPIWLLDTGDGTTFGDVSSLEQWLNDWSVRFLGACGSRGRQLILYGNHDAWPKTHPLIAPRSMQTHRDYLRSTWFTDTYPRAPLSTGIPGSAGSEIQLFSLNSVVHGLFENVRALGEVLPDRFWEPTPSGAGPRGPTAIDELSRLVTSLSTGGAPGVRHLRLIAMHYPVAKDASGAKRLTEILVNRDAFGREVGSSKFGSPPMFPLFFGGHTHGEFPPLGLLPRSASFARHDPLPAPLTQLVSGSLSQIRLSSGSVAASYAEQLENDYPYRASVFRFSALQSNEIAIERITVGCQVGGAFEMLPIIDGGSICSEDFVLVI